MDTARPREPPEADSKCVVVFLNRIFVVLRARNFSGDRNGGDNASGSTAAARFTNVWPLPPRLCLIEPVPLRVAG